MSSTRRLISAPSPLAEQRQADGLRVLVANRDDVFDSSAMAAPAQSPFVISCVTPMTTGPRPRQRFVLLVGDARLDYHDRLNGKFKNILPTYLLTQPT